MKYLKYISENIDEIKGVFTKSFSDSEGESEGELIGELVLNLMSATRKNDIHVFLAKEGEKIRGCIIFTRLRFESSDINAFIMSPVAVLTSFQGKGVGQELIKFGINSLKSHGVELIFTYGDPDFYSKVGFRHVEEKIIRAPLKMTYPEGWIAQSLTGEEIKPIPGSSFCVEALNKPVYW